MSASLDATLALTPRTCARLSPVALSPAMCTLSTIDEPGKNQGPDEAQGSLLVQSASSS